MSEYLSDETTEVPHLILKNKLRWIKVIVVLLLILVVFFAYQMIKREIFIKMNHQITLENANYKMMMSQENLMNNAHTLVTLVVS